MTLRKIFTALFALLLTAGILLVSDLGNRQHSKDTGIRKDGNYKIGITYFGPDASFDMVVDGLLHGLADLGYVKDKNLSLVMAHANGEISNLPLVHLNMDNSDVDLIIPTSTPGIASAVSTVKKHSMVFTMTYTPLAVGVGKSFTDHLPNLTGLASFPPVEKTFDFICESFPGTKRIGTLYNSSEANSRKVVEVARAYAESLGIELVETTVVNTSEVYQAMESLAQRNVDAVWITGDNTALQAFHAIVKVCDARELPLVVNDVEYTEQGALAAVGIGWYQTGYRTADYVVRVLEGANPVDIPIINYVEEAVAINRELAAQRGIVFPEKYTAQETFKPKKQYRFCMVHYVDSPNSEDVEDGIRDGLKALNWVEDVDFTLQSFNAQGDISTMNSICDAVVGKPWDLVFVSSTPTTQLLAKKVTHAPVVFTAVGDPVAAGLGDSFEEHLPNLTGISTLSDFDGLLQLLQETMPGVKTIGTVFTPGEINSVAYNTRFQAAARARGITLISMPANSVTEVADAALSLASQRIDAFTQISDNLTATCSAAIIKTAYENHIPYSGFISNQINQGAVACFSRDYYRCGVEAVDLAVEILQGKDPAEIPYRMMGKSKVSVNEEAERYFEVKIPEHYLKENP